MLDGMEEEALNASEQMAARLAAAEETRAELEKKGLGQSGQEAMPGNEAELRAALARETAEKLAAQEKELRAELERRARAEHERLSAENERVLRKKLEEELRPQIESKLRSEMERQLHASPPKAHEPDAEQVTPGPTTSPSAMPASRPQPGTTPLNLSKTPPPVRPVPGSVFSTAAKPVTPAPVTTAKAIASSTAAKGVDPSTAAPAPAKTAAAAPGAIPTMAQPAGPQSKVETAPMALMGSGSRANVRSPAAAASAQSAQPRPQPTVTEGHERAKRRARVILSDLSVYHRDDLLKAAHAADPKQELGTLWRDAVISYNEVAPPELRSVTNYLEEELDKYLVQLRSG